MGKKYRCIDEKGEEISPDELPDAMYDFLRAVASINAKNKLPPTSLPPKDLREFEERLGELYERQYTRFFGLAFETSSGKILRKEANAEALVKCLIDFEKNEQPIYYAHIEAYKFLKMVLEKDAPLFENDMYLLGINRDRSGLFLPQKNVISVQCAAQVLWHLEKGEIPTIFKKYIGRHRPKNQISRITIFYSRISPIIECFHEFITAISNGASCCNICNRSNTSRYSVGRASSAPQNKRGIAKANSPLLSWYK